MPRKPRIEFPGAFYHVIARGNNRQTVFEDKKDFEEFLQSLAGARERFPYTLYAYVLMTNHFHLLIETQQFPLSRIMGSVLTRYSRSFNRRHKRIGHLFAARYKAILCQKDAYLLELVRYIHLNPVRAHMVKSPADWPWSSHRTYLGRAPNPFLNTQEVLTRFSRMDSRARAAYAGFVREGLSFGHKNELYPPETLPLLGSTTFVKEMTRQQKDLEPSSRPLSLPLPELAERLCVHLKLAAPALQGPSRERSIARARAFLAFLSFQYARLPLNKVARFLHRHPSALTKAFRSAKHVFERNPAQLKQVLTAVSK